jgi:hypothetical protein
MAPAAWVVFEFADHGDQLVSLAAALVLGQERPIGLDVDGLLFTPLLGVEVGLELAGLDAELGRDPGSRRFLRKGVGWVKGTFSGTQIPDSRRERGWGSWGSPMPRCDRAVAVTPSTSASFCRKLLCHANSGGRIDAGVCRCAIGDVVVSRLVRASGVDDIGEREKHAVRLRAESLPLAAVE